MSNMKITSTERNLLSEICRTTLYRTYGGWVCNDSPKKHSLTAGEKLISKNLAVIQRGTGSPRLRPTEAGRQIIRLSKKG